MKTILVHPLRAVAALAVIFQASQIRAVESVSGPMSVASEGGRIVIQAETKARPVPFFFSASAEQVVKISHAEIVSEVRLKLHVVQGRPESITLGLSGDGEVTEVSGAGLRDWSVRQGAGAAVGKRFLDLHPVMPAVDVAAPKSAATPQDFEFVVRTRLRKPAVPGATSITLVTMGDAVGFASKVTLQPDASTEVKVTAVNALTALGDDNLQFVVTGDARLDVRLAQRGASPSDAELVGVVLAGKVNEVAGSVEFQLRGQLRVQKLGARLRLLSGRAALSDKAVGDGWHVELVPLGEQRFAYDLVGDRVGSLAIDLAFAAAIREEGDWRTVNFRMPAGAVVPLQLDGLADGVSFKPDAPVVPAAAPTGAARLPWQGFLPADGAASFAWKRTRESGEGALAFTSFEQSDVRIGAGLLRQTSKISFRILQGKLPGVHIALDGPGEILGIEGANIIGWRVLPTQTARELEIRFSRPMEAEGTLNIHSQAELGAWPVRAEPLRLTPQGGVRHSGFVRVANHGAVRLEVTDVAGMMQLAPAQFPGGTMEPEARQIFVYRFPSAIYGYRVLATQIQPEVSLSVIATYELGETARVINANLELDIRDAPMREWALRVPAEYTVVGVNGSDVSDYVAETETAGDMRALRVLFGRPIEGRQLLHLRLERNQPAAAGDWRLPALQFPGAKSVRGHIGAISTPGYRLVPSRAERLVEVPLSFFPRQMAGLQQAWRLREPDWLVDLRIEALGQSVQADVFHLYALKEGVVTASVLLNYFVVGAPASEWRIEVPPEIGNIDVVGQNVRRDWRREGNQLTVSLHQPVLGAATLLVTFEQPMSARGGVISPGQVRPINVQTERGFIQVVSPLQVKHEIRRADGGLLKLEPAELPLEFRTFSSSPSLAVYQYTARPFAFELGIEWYEPGETVDQVIDFAKLSSRVSRDGQVATEAQFFVKTRGRKALRVVLPKGVQLWEARVDGEIVNARADGDQTLIPLPARTNPNEPVVVALRVGQPAAEAGAIGLIAPRAVAVPTVISEWVVRADEGRLLVPRRGNAELVTPTLTETGFEWVSERGAAGTFGLLLLLGFTLFALRAAKGWAVPASLFLCLVAMAAAGVMTFMALYDRRVNLRELTFAATVVPSDEAVSLQLANVGEWRAMLVGWGLAALAVGVGLFVLSAVLRRRGIRREGTAATAFGGADLFSLLGAALVGAGLLAQRGGAVAFFAALGVTMLLFVFLPALVRWRRDRALTGDEPEAGSAAASTVSLIVLCGLIGLTGLASSARAQSPALTKPATSDVSLHDSTKPAQAVVQNWSIREDRLFADAEFTVRGSAGESFLLLRAPAVLTEFKGDGLRVGKRERDGRTDYYVALERDGLLTARVRFEMSMPDRSQPIALPTGPAATQRVTIELDQGGWGFASSSAMMVVPTGGLGEQRSGATLVLAPQLAPTIRLQPKRRDLASESPQFFAEVANLFVPGPGVVNGHSRVTVRPAQGRVSSLEIAVPVGLTVGEVSQGPVGAWRFDPQTRRLHIDVEPAQERTFAFTVETQLGAGELPFALALEPLRVLGAAGDVGMIALAFTGDAQPEAIRPSELSAVNVQDFDSALLPKARDGQVLATLQQVWRYGPTGGRVELKVAPVAAEVRVTGRQVLSLDDDRLVVSADLRVAITRVGLFKLSFMLPDGLEIEALSGAALSHWTEALENGRRIVTLHLKGRTLGEQTFNLALAGAAPRQQDAWPLPRLLVREATRQTGEVLVVPGKGIRLRAVEREGVTQLDPRTVGGLQPGTLAFRLLQDNWVLRLGIETLEPWVTVQSLREVTVREGQTLTRLALRYRVENAAVKSVQLRLPGLTEESARTVRATGPAVSDTVRVGEAPDLWEIRFQRGIAGETDVQVEFQGAAVRENGRESVATAEFPGVRQATQYVAVRSGGRLELEAGALPRGWLRVDWVAVPANLQNRSDRSVPAMTFRVAEPESALPLTVRRHDVAEALKLRVTKADLMTLFAPTGAFLTAVDLDIDVLEKGTLRVRLPAGAQLFNTFVNGESVAVVREGDAWLFHVSPHSVGDRSARVRLIYSATDKPNDSISLLAPSLSVPLENVTWSVVLPPGYEMDDYGGGLRLQEVRYGSMFGIEEYRTVVDMKRAAVAQQSLSLLQDASAMMQRGEQDKAAEALSRVWNSATLDEASNEDARIQLRSLKTQQAILGLNTRRQRLYLDNRADTARNEQLEQAANLNPFMQGKANFDPRQVDQLLMGNTAEENTALRGIASRIVDQQLSADPAPGAIDLTLPERGRVLMFTRTLQVDGGSPLELTLDIEKTTPSNKGVIALLLGGIVGLAALELRRRSPVRG